MGERGRAASKNGWYENQGWVGYLKSVPQDRRSLRIKSHSFQRSCMCWRITFNRQCQGSLTYSMSITMKDIRRSASLQRNQACPSLMPIISTSLPCTRSDFTFAPTLTIKGGDSTT